jgi:hypothetical protein
MLFTAVIAAVKVEHTWLYIATFSPTDRTILVEVNQRVIVVS